MAEIINKPEKFTKEWFSYIWCYYKVHILVMVAVIALVIYTIYDFSTIIKYDLKLSFITTSGYSQEIQDKLQAESIEVIEDINKNGSKDFLVTQLSFSDKIMNDVAQLSAAQDKLMTLLVSEDEMLYVCDEYMLKRILDMEMTEGAFIPVNEWGNAEIAETLGYEYAGDVYGASLKESSMLKEIGIDTENLYIMVKMNLKPEDEEITAKFNESIKFANILVK